MSTWYKTGIEAVDEFIGKGVQVLLPLSIWGKKGETKRLFVLDDDVTMLAVFHKKRVGKAWSVIPCNSSNPALAKANGGQCEMDKDGSGQHLLGPLTVLDMTGYTDAQGREHKHQKRIWLANEPLLVQLRALRKQHGSLQGLFLDVSWTRDEFNSPGDKIDVTKGKDGRPTARLKPEKWAEAAKKWEVDTGRDPMTPYFYDGFIRPMSNEEMRAFLAKNDAKAPASSQAQSESVY